MPYQIFPGIFSTIDSYSKKITWKHWEKYNQVPPWFSPFGEFTEPVKVPHFSKFSIVDKETGVQLRGVPDEIFKAADKSYFIVDYKTAKFTENQDALLPLYIVQLNSYALIGEQCGFSPICGLGLVYYEPQTEVSVDNIDSALLDEGFSMPFKAHLLRLELDAEKVVLPLLRRVREFSDLGEAPRGRSGCGDCGKLGGVVGLL